MADLSELRRLAEAAITWNTTACGSVEIMAMNNKFQRLDHAQLFIELLDENESLKCCGNCRHSAMNFSSGTKMLCKMRTMGAMDNYAKDKCDKWQG